MTEIAEKALKYLRSTGKKSFTHTDLTNGTNIHLSEITANKVIEELERNGYIETHPEYITNPFNLI